MREIEKILVDLVKHELNLPDNYGYDADGNEIPCVCIKSQNIKLFNTPNMQVTISTVSSNVFSNRTEHFQGVHEGVEGFFERTNINEQRMMQIDVYSKTNEARQRFWEVQASLTSDYAKSLQYKYSFRLSRVSNSYNNSGLDGGSDINRYTIRFNCLTWQEKVKLVDYYDTFETQVRKKNNDLFADFVITETEE